MRILNGKAIKALGAVFLLASLWFVGNAVSAHWQSLGDWRPTQSLWVSLAGLAAIYAASLFLLAEAWHRIVQLYGTEPRSRTFPSLTSTQLARYMPGNVAHLFGRAAWLHGRSLSNAGLLRATAVELCVTPTSALLALLILLPALVVGSSPILAAASICAALVLAAIWLGLTVVKPDGAGAKTWVRRLKGSLALSMLFMLILGSLFAAIGYLLGLSGGPILIAAAIVAWIVGYLAPGIPGGLGVREAVLIALLSGHGAPDTVVLASALLRLVTTSGEVICFLAGFGVARLVRGPDKVRA